MTNVIHRVITVTDFQYIGNEMKCIGTRTKSKTFEKRDPEPMTIERYWLKDAPISYHDMESEMKRTGIISEDHTWQLFHKGGSAQRYLRAFYNLLHKSKCLPAMSGRELMEAFNISFKTKLDHYRGFNGKEDCQNQEEEIINRLSVFGNVFSEKNSKAIRH